MHQSRCQGRINLSFNSAIYGHAEKFWTVVEHSPLVRCTTGYLKGLWKTARLLGMQDMENAVAFGIVKAVALLCLGFLLMRFVDQKYDAWQVHAAGKQAQAKVCASLSQDLQSAKDAKAHGKRIAIFPDGSEDKVDNVILYNQTSLNNECHGESGAAPWPLPDLKYE